MTVETSTSRVQYNTNGTTGPWTVPFYFLANADLRVVHTDADGIEDELTLTTDYSVSGAADPAGGTVTTVTAYASGGLITILRDVEALQPTDYSDTDAFPANTLEQNLDRLTMLAQQVQEVADRAIVLPVSENNDTTLPVAADRANRLLAFDASGDVTLLVGVDSGSAAALQLDLADTSSTVKGDAMIGVKLNATGSATRTQHAKNADVVNLLDFSGADSTGATNSDTAISSALTALASGGVLEIGPGTWAVGTAFSIPPSVQIRGAGKGATTLLKKFNGNLITAFGSNASLENLTIDGNSGTYTGKGIMVAASSFGQQILNCEVVDFSSACLEFAGDGGSQFRSISSTYATTGTVGTTAAVKVNGTDTSAVPRHFIATESNGCTLFDFGGCNHFWAHGFYTNGLVFSSSSAFNIELRGMRCGSLGGTITAQGDSHWIEGVSAVAWVCQATSSFLRVQAPSWNVTEASPAANNSISLINPAAWTPTLTASGGGASLGNSTVNVRWSRESAWVMGEVDITLGSTFAAGSSGLWEFALPVADIGTGAVEVCGSGMITNAGSTSGQLVVVRVTPAGTKVRLYYQNGGNVSTVGVGAPWAWAAGDIIRFNFRYRVA